MPPFDTLLSSRNEPRLLAAMLGVLHYALWWEFGGPLSRSLLLAHLGLVLLWQPLWHRERRLDWRGATAFVVATLSLVVWVDWSLMAFWLVLLIGLVGGRVTSSKRQRLVYLLTLVMLISELLVGAVPRMFAVRSVSAPVLELFRYGLFVVPAGLALLAPYESHRQRTPTVDFFYGLTLSLLSTIVALGSLLLMYSSGVAYSVALFQSVLAVALFLFAISWLWLPIAGFSGLGQLWERYVQNVGTPFEHWLARLTSLARTRGSAEEFLDAAAHQLAELPWVIGLKWGIDGNNQQLGNRSDHSFRHPGTEPYIEVYAARPIGPALFLHGVLLLRLIAHFYGAKVRERELSQRAHLQAIYETGARVTHDIKNLLQSLHTLSSAFEQSTGREAEFHALFRRQLPHLTERLELALAKLNAPETGPAEHCSLAEWWRALEQRNAGRGVSFSAHLDGDHDIPRDLFESITDNLLENARLKRIEEPGIDIRVRLDADSNGIQLRVHDNGSPVAASLARHLFKAPVASRSGLGIGLYQAARQAQRQGFRLRLDEDQPGVCVLLESVDTGKRDRKKGTHYFLSARGKK